MTNLISKLCEVDVDGVLKVVELRHQVRGQDLNSRQVNVVLNVVYLRINIQRLE